MIESDEKGYVTTIKQLLINASPTTLGHPLYQNGSPANLDSSAERSAL
jgi:hypothetical protein